MTRLFQLCEEPDPESEQVGGDPARCDFLRGHSGGHSWELERERRARAVQRGRERRAGQRREERRWEKRGESRFCAR